jgi:uncharacterized protein (TIGR00369 family)
MSDDEQPITRLVNLVFPNQTNHLGTLFGGHALSMMDMAASIAAHRYCRHTVVTASIERTDFLTPVYGGELVEVTGQVVRTGRTSLVVQVELVAEDLESGDRRLCTRGIFNMVALDKSGRPTPVPPLNEVA